jgi:hypothetical protein
MYDSDLFFTKFLYDTNTVIRVFYTTPKSSKN